MGIPVTLTADNSVEKNRPGSSGRSGVFGYKCFIWTGCCHLRLTQISSHISFWFGNVLANWLTTDQFSQLRSDEKMMLLPVWQFNFRTTTTQIGQVLSWVRSIPGPGNRVSPVSCSSPNGRAWSHRTSDSRLHNKSHALNPNKGKFHFVLMDKKFCLCLRLNTTDTKVLGYWELVEAQTGGSASQGWTNSTKALNYRNFWYSELVELAH